MNYHPLSESFATGDHVVARFTNSHRLFEFTGIIVGRTKNYWKVQADGLVYATDSPDRVFHIHTIESGKRTINNCIYSKIEVSQ